MRFYFRYPGGCKTAQGTHAFMTDTKIPSKCVLEVNMSQKDR